MTVRSSAPPWANWHFSPYLQVPCSENGLHNSVLYRLVLTLVEVLPLDEVVDEAEEWLSTLLILFLSLSNSEIFLSRFKAAEAAESLSAKSELKEAANWLKAASRGSEDEADEGVEMVDEGDEKSRLEDMGDEELEDICLL